MSYPVQGTQLTVKYVVEAYFTTYFISYFRLLRISWYVFPSVH